MGQLISDKSIYSDIAGAVHEPIVNAHFSLDEIEAARRFSGKCYNDALVIFGSDEVWVAEDLMWMAQSGFIYYFSAFLEVLECKAKSGDELFCDRVAFLISVLSFRGREFLVGEVALLKTC